jgi:hypothetical protein
LDPIVTVTQTVTCNLVNRRPGQMMVHASKDVDVFNVSIYSWADNAHRTPSHLPSNFHHDTSAPMPVPNRLPDGSCALQEDMRCFCPRESMMVAAPREKKSFHPQVRLQEKKPRIHLTKEAIIKSRLQTYLFPIAISVFRVGCCVEGWLRELIASHCLRELPSMS